MRLLLLLTTSAALGCAPARPALVRHGRAATPATPPPARGEFARGEGERVLQAAQALLRASGDRIAHRSALRVATVPRERDVPCAAGSCLARESVEVRVGHYVARVELSRTLWNAATRSWDRALGVVEARDAVAQQQLMLRRILEACPPPGPAELAALGTDP